MGYKIISASSLLASPGPHPAASPYDKGIGRQLGLQTFDVYQVELPPHAHSVEHDHSDDGAEDMYAVIQGEGHVVVDGQDMAVQAGTYVAVTADSSRYIQADAAGLVYIAVCTAPY
jgi:uncharacterized cupin superfamily protein